MNSFTNHRRGLDLAIKDDGETFADVSLRQFPERCRAFGIELQCHSPALLIKSSEALGDTVAQQIGALLYEQLLFHRTPAGRLLLRFDAVSRWDQLSPGFDPCDEPITLRMDETEFELRHLCQLLPGRDDLRGVEAWNLNQDSI